MGKQAQLHFVQLMEPLTALVQVHPLVPCPSGQAGICTIFQVVCSQSATGRSGLFLQNGSSSFASLVSVDLIDLLPRKYCPFGCVNEGCGFYPLSTF